LCAGLPTPHSSYRNAVKAISPGLALSLSKGLPWDTMRLISVTLKAFHNDPAKHV
jgi:hypothetical protein